MAKVTLWINQLPFSTTERDLAAHFAEAAGVTADALLPHVRLLKKNGEFKGTAFLDVNGYDAADRGVELHQSRFKASDGQQRRINVREAVSKTQLEAIAERSKESRGKVLAKAFGGKTKAKPPPPQPKIYSDEESDDDDEEKDSAEEGEEEDEEEEEASGCSDDDNEQQQMMQPMSPTKTEGVLGKDRLGRTVVGEIDPQRKRLREEEEYLKKRREREDMLVTCTDCGGEFKFTVFEQEFFLEKKWPIPRKRCKACTTAKRSKPSPGAHEQGSKQQQQQQQRDAKGGVRERGAAAEPQKGRAAPKERPTLEPGSKKGPSGAEAPKKKKGGAADMTCFICGEVGHIANGCPQKKEGSVFKCHNCGENGHKRAECPKGLRKHPGAKDAKRARKE